MATTGKSNSERQFNPTVRGNSTLTLLRIRVSGAVN